MCWPVLLLLPLTAPGDFESAWVAHDLEGHEPWASVAADLDGDGLLDLATTSWPGAAARLSVALADGDGGLAAPLASTPLEPGLGIAAADLDLDGDLDLAVSHTGQAWDGASVGLWENVGGGAFPVERVFAAGPGPSGLDAGDLDGDGDADLAVALDEAITSGSTLAVLHGNGGWSFGPAVTTALPGSSYDARIADLDGDGTNEIVVAGEQCDVTLVDLVAGAPVPGPTYPALPGCGMQQHPTLELADVDGDLDVDVLYGARSFDGGRIGLLRNGGTGLLSPSEVLSLGELGGPDDLAVVDLDADGAVDVLAALVHESTWAVLRGDGDGGFLPVEPHGTGGSPHGIHAADLEGDGDLDVVVVLGVGAAAVHPGSGGATFPELAVDDLVDPALAPAEGVPPAAGDLDGDGDLDLVVGFAQGFDDLSGLLVSAGNGDGTFAAPALSASPGDPVAVRLADLDGDGALDAVWASDEGFDGRLRWRYGDGGGGFGPEAAGPTVPCHPQALALGDTDGDGDLDAAFPGCFGKVHLAENVAGAFGAPSQHAVGDQAEALGFGDLDEDGALDLVSNTGVQSYPEISRGVGDGTFLAPYTVQAGNGVEAIGVADLDRDGHLDLATLDETGDTVTVLLGRGDGSFQPPSSYEAASDDARQLLVADADHDGDLDLLAPNPVSRDVSLWRNDGEGGLAPQVRLGVGPAPAGLAVGAFDGDGAVDLVVLVHRPDPSAFGFHYPALVTMRGLAADAWADLGGGLAGTRGVPELAGYGLLEGGTPVSLELGGAAADAPGALVVGGEAVSTPLLGGVIVPAPQLLLAITTDAAGASLTSETFPAGVAPGLQLVAQAWILDAGAPQGVAASNAVEATVP